MSAFLANSARLESMQRSVLAVLLTASAFVPLLSAPAHADSEQFDLCRRKWAKIAAQKSFRAVIDPGTAAATTVDVVSPDRLHSTSAQDEVFVIGSKMWRRSAGGPMRLMGAPPGPGLSSFEPWTAYAPGTKDGSCNDHIELWRGLGTRVIVGSWTAPVGRVTATLYEDADGIHHLDLVAPHEREAIDFSKFGAVTVGLP